MKSLILICCFIVCVIFFGFQIVRLYTERAELEMRLQDAYAQKKEFASENEQLESDISFFDEKENLVKEVKKQFNYVEEGEKLLIIIPNTKIGGE